MTVYRKLPGSYHTPISGAKMRLADDHILVATSFRVQEQYRRFYLRDIQAITVTRSANWALTTRSLLLAIVIAWLSIFTPMPGLVWAILGALVLAWAGLCIWAGCVCRIYTATSAETLPVRRIWQADKLVEQLEPLIRDAQSSIDWQAKPEPEASTLAEPGSESNPLPSAEPQPTAASTLLNPDQARYRTLAGILLPGALFLAGAAAAARYFGPPSASSAWVLVIELLLAVQLGCALWIIIEHARQRTANAPQRLAIVFLILTGIAGYAQSLTSTLAGTRSGRGAFTTMYQAPDAAFWNIYGVGCLILAIIGIVAWLTSPEKEPS